MQITYWKLYFITIGSILSSCAVSSLLSWGLYRWGLVSGISIWLFFWSLGLMPLLIFNYRKGVIFDSTGFGLEHKPSKSFYFNLGLQSFLVAFMFFLSIYAFIIGN